MKLSTKTVNDILARWSNEDIVTDTASEYGESGYSHDASLNDDDTPIVVLGDYWCHCKTWRDKDGEPGLHDYAVHHPKLWEQLEAQGVSFEWNDEWTVDHENNKAYRTQPDSYMWQPSVVWDESTGDYLTPDDDIDTWIEWAIADDASRCLLSNVHSEADVLAAGFEKFNGQYENGFHPGQTDDPKVIADAIRKQHSKYVRMFEDVMNQLINTPLGWIETAARLTKEMVAAEIAIGTDVDVVFMLDDTGQFDMRFSAYWRFNDQNEDAEDEEEANPWTTYSSEIFAEPPA